MMEMNEQRRMKERWWEFSTEKQRGELHGEEREEREVEEAYPALVPGSVEVSWRRE